MPSVEPSADAGGQSGERDDEQPSLPALLSALALGARAVNALPISSSDSGGGGGEDSSDDDDKRAGGSGGDDDDEFAFQMAFPEFASLCGDARTALAELLSESLAAAPSPDNPPLRPGGKAGIDPPCPRYDFDDPLLWIKAADACDALLEKVDAYVEGVESGAAAKSLKNAAESAREKARGKYRLMMEGLAEVEKPQISYEFMDTVQNDRLEPFKPPIHPSKPHSIQPLLDSFALRKGYGLATKNGELASGKLVVPTDVVAPSEHYPHPYRGEIEALQFRDWQLETLDKEELGQHGLGGTLNRFIEQEDDNDGNDIKKEVNASSQAIVNEGLWIDSVDGLKRLTQRIQTDESIREIAVDLEAHSYRSFSGFVCLMQISLRRSPLGNEVDLDDTPVALTGDSIETASDFLIDTLALRRQLNKYVAPIFADPDIVKVMHGADMDVRWLQRDFGIYIVNLFDTYRAAKHLISTGKSETFPAGSGAGLAVLLSRYAGLEVDKRHQMSDWRRRPIPPDMRAYATSDTLYLLDVYDCIRVDLEAIEPDGKGVKAVLGESRKVCLLRYDKEAFYPSRYKNLLRGKRNLTALKRQALKVLYNWRDQVARDEDESIQYVCTDSALVRLCAASPRSVAELRDLLNPVPPLISSRAEEMLNIIRSALKGNTIDGVAPAADCTKKTAATSSSPERISQLRASASPFAFKPARDAGATPAQLRPPSSTSIGKVDGGMMSPVVGTEALYRQAGWMTPEVTATGASGQGFDGQSSEEEDGHRSQQLLNVDKANKGYVASKYTSHSLEMGNSVNPPSPIVDEEKQDDEKKQNRRGSRGRTVDGLGAARAALGREELSKCEGAKNQRSVEDEARLAKEGASKIRDQFVSEGGSTFLQVEAFGSGKVTLDGETCNIRHSSNEHDANNEENGAEEFTVPKTMREIFQISNRNRNRSSKSGGKLLTAPSPMADSDLKGTENMEVDCLAGAEDVLAARGKDGHGYFGNGSAEKSSDNDGKVGGNGRTKRQRTKSQEGDKGALVGHEEIDRQLVSKGDDVAVMESVGWTKGGREEARKLMVDDQQDSGKVGENHGNGCRGGKDASGSKRDVATFDYSKVGPIGAYGPMAPAAQSSNPFFSGAAIKGAPAGPDRGSKKGSSSTSKGRSRGNGSRSSAHRSSGTQHS